MTWLGTLLNGLSGSKPRREVAVTIGDGVQAQGMPREAVAMDSWRRDSALKSRPALNAAPVLNSDVITESSECYTDYIDSVEFRGSILGEILDSYIEDDVFAPTLPIKSPSGTIIYGLIGALP